MLNLGVDDVNYSHESLRQSWRHELEDSYPNFYLVDRSRHNIDFLKEVNIQKSKSKRVKKAEDKVKAREEFMQLQLQQEQE